jgi:hypothetical protein
MIEELGSGNLLKRISQLHLTSADNLAFHESKTRLWKGYGSDGGFHQKIVGRLFGLRTGSNLLLTRLYSK